MPDAEHPENGQALPDPTNILSLPDYIRVMISNYQPLQTVFAVANGEFHTRQIKKDEKFSPIVTIEDAVTQQTLDCMLLLHGEEPQEVNYSTLFCYIAVQVRGSHPNPQYHIESEQCTHGKLPLTFCFHQPGASYDIRLSIHSIADSEGVEYTYHSEDCTCTVQILDRKLHNCHSGCLRMKEPPQHRYTGPLATKRFHKIAQLFEKLYSPSKYMQIKKLANCIVGGLKAWY